jgi:hypothetical protein
LGSRRLLTPPSRADRGQHTQEPKAGMTNPRLCFVDSVGTDWRIYEVASANVPAPRGRNCLIFESSQAVRRVWNYPSNWHNLSTDELSALSWNT